MKTVFIMIGVPGSGKSTWVEENTNGTVVSADHYWVGEDGVYRFDQEVAKTGVNHRECFRLFVEAIDRGDEEVVVDNTNTSLWERDKYKAYAEIKGYNVLYVNITFDDVDECFKRNTHNVPRHTIERMAKRRDLRFTDGKRIDV